MLMKINYIFFPAIQMFSVMSWFSIVPKKDVISNDIISHTTRDTLVVH